MLTLQQLKNTYSNERVILVLLARLHFNTVTLPEVNDFIANHTIDWALAHKLCKAHGVRPFIYYIIKQHNISTIPAFENRLQKNYNISRYKNLRLAITTSKLINDFKEKGIKIIPYKGTVFGHSYYPDIALRESSDIDFLIDINDVKAVEDYFISNNYSPKTTIPRGYLNYYKTFFKDIVYQTPGDDAFSVEMHWRLMEHFSGSYPGYQFFIPHLENYTLGGLHANKLSPTYDMLVVISNHFVKDMSIKFKYLVDIACLIQKENSTIDKNVVFETAVKYGFMKKLEMGLALTESLLGVSLNGTPKAAIPDTYLQVPLALPLHLPRLYINEPEFIKRSLQLQDSDAGRFKFVLKCLKYAFLPTYEDINQLKLPAYCLPFIIVARPFRLAYQKLSAGSNKKPL